MVRFRTDDSMQLKGFSASYVAIDPFETSDEMNSDSRSSEFATPFPGYLKSMVYKTDSSDYDTFEDLSENHLLLNTRARINNNYNHRF